MGFPVAADPRAGSQVDVERGGGGGGAGSEKGERETRSRKTFSTYPVGLLVGWSCCVSWAKKVQGPNQALVVVSMQ